MTIQAICFLRLLKKAQGSENQTVLLHTNVMKAASQISAGEKRTSPIVDISHYQPYLDSVLSYLQNRKYIEFEEVSGRQTRVIQVKVNHTGWHLFQTAVGYALSFLFRSVAIPIAVSAITTVIALKLTTWLSGS